LVKYIIICNLCLDLFAGPNTVGWQIGVRLTIYTILSITIMRSILPSTGKADIVEADIVENKNRLTPGILRWMLKSKYDEFSITKSHII
jgi:hypothetical protein